MFDVAKKYVETCQFCQRDKPRTQAPLGLLKPLPIPAGPGQSVSMDFMDTLVTSKSGKRHIFVIIDRFTKYARLVAMPETSRTDYVIKLFKDNWERTIIVIFQTKDQTLGLSLREQLIHIYEDGWYRDPARNPSAKSGKTHGEGPNVMSYVARSLEIARWMTNVGAAEIPCRGGSFKVLFKPWMMGAKLDDMRNQEQASRFRLIALLVPLVAMFTLQIDRPTSPVGKVLKMHPSDKKEDEPSLGNVKIDCESGVRDSYRDWIYVRSKDGADLEIRIAT
ncbi:hypothetical protein CBR_g34849 [Chara braunii]|uniref:Integrase catalytic domain-containing protein n=1 Tax=Chara braunii TaxID=69332 RepID=A0A388LJQ2_CHABU|nr:hypothetical protein CBR_g34849 [Chara braunii]|eukprot:GBG82473.1 hypothetical protein CBR_g34849 [Chara braunii]